MLRESARTLPFIALDLRPGFGRRSARPAVKQLDAAPLPLPGGYDAGGGAVQKLDTLDCVETEADSYTITRASEAIRRVLCWNAPTGDAARRKRVTELRRKHSLLGVYGHTERMNAWTHVFGAVVFLAWSIARPFSGVDTQSQPARLTAASSALSVVVFFVSTTYHVFGPVRKWSGWLRVSDHGAIYIGLAIASIADVAIATRGFENTPWLTVADPVIVACVLLGFFLYRRAVLPTSATEIAWGECALGLFRFQHSDYEFGALRSAGYVALSFFFVQIIPLAYANLTHNSATTMTLCNAAAVGLLVLGLLLDNVVIWPDISYEKQYYDRKPPSLFCHNRSCGCITTSHAIWHLATCLSVGILTVGREVVLADEQF
jgi:predicted membrane channel-forming protein YqfA (hemolysin III family)